MPSSTSDRTHVRNRVHQPPSTPNPTSWRLEVAVAVLGALVGLTAVLLFLG